MTPSIRPEKKATPLQIARGLIHMRAACYNCRETFDDDRGVDLWIRNHLTQHPDHAVEQQLGYRCTATPGAQRAARAFLTAQEETQK